jgi:lipase
MDWDSGLVTIPVFIPETKFDVPVRGGNLALFRYGPAGGTPVLLIHGVTSSNRAWQFFAQSLITRGYTPFAVDLRGRGDSNSLPGPFGMSAHADDMLAVVDFLGVQNIEVIGHSMGAFVALAFVGKYPSRVSRTTLIDGGIPLPLPAGMTVAQVLPFVLGPALARLAMTFESKESYRDYWKTNPALASNWGPALDEYADYDLRGSAPELHASTNAKAVEEDSIDLFESDLIVTSLKGLNDEVLLIRAERGLQNEPTPLYPLQVLEPTLVNYPKIKVITIADTNHYDIVISARGAEETAAAIFGEV